MGQVNMGNQPQDLIKEHGREDQALEKLEKEEEDLGSPSTKISE
jgi:hypothetical protein